MGGFTNEELDNLNLGKNYKYPDTTYIEDKAQTIIPETDDNDVVFKFTVSVLLLMGFLMGMLFYLRSNGMHIGNMFKGLKNKMKIVRVSTKTMVMPK
jgi:hypothetical protein